MKQTDFFAYVESWWGGQLDQRLIQTIASAPAAQLAAFSDSVELEESPPQLKPAKLRPAVARSMWDRRFEDQFSTALRLLLYSHEVLVDSSDFDELTYIGEDLVDNEKRRNIALSLSRLKAVRPLVEDGSMYMASLASRGRHPAVWPLFVQAGNDPGVQRLLSEMASTYGLRIDDDERTRADALYGLVGQVVAASTLAAVQKAHPLARSLLDESILSAFLGQERVDQRQLRLTTLARLQVPRLETDTGNLVQLRQSAEQFAQWRQSLSRALDVVATLPDLGDGGKEAAAIMTDELSASFETLRKANRKSPFVKAAIGGATGLAISGVSAGTTGALTGNPWVALASGAGGKLAESVITYAKAVRTRAQARAILDVVLTFNDDRPDL